MKTVPAGDKPAGTVRKDLSASVKVFYHLYIRDILMNTFICRKKDMCFCFKNKDIENFFNFF